MTESLVDRAKRLADQYGDASFYAQHDRFDKRTELHAAIDALSAPAGEAVAWQISAAWGDGTRLWNECSAVAAKKYENDPTYEIRPLYAAPQPTPDASQDGGGAVDSIDAAIRAGARAALAALPEPRAGEAVDLGIVEQSMTAMIEALVPSFAYVGVSLRVSAEDHATIRSALAGLQTGRQLVRNALAASPIATPAAQALYVIFDGPPSHESGRFVELETAAGKSVGKQCGADWIQRPDGLWSLGPFLRFSCPPAAQGEAPAVATQEGLKPLTRERLAELFNQAFNIAGAPPIGHNSYKFARAIERAHGIDPGAMGQSGGAA